MLNWLKSILGLKTSVSVSIPVQEQFPSQEELAGRNQVMDTLDAQNIGTLVGAGAGFGQMDFQYLVKDRELAKRQIAAAIEQHLPGMAYELRG